MCTVQATIYIICRPMCIYNICAVLTHVCIYLLNDSKICHVKVFPVWQKDYFELEAPKKPRLQERHSHSLCSAPRTMS